MLFKLELAILIVRKEKTETRRLRKRGEALVMRDGYKTVLTISGRIKYQVGRTYAVQYGYGKPTCWWWLDEHNEPAILPFATLEDIFHGAWTTQDEERDYQELRIKLLDIRCEDVRDISESGAIADGFDDQRGFWEVWCSFYDKPAFNYLTTEENLEVYDSYLYLQMAPPELYQAWALTFELVK